MMTFLSPLLAWGALLGVIPLIIHLLNRRKFRRVDWAPMRYLKLTVQRNRRRVQVEQLLLMLLRIAALALLFFYLARPVINPTGLEGWLGNGGRSSQVVLIDDSLSMGYGSSESPAFRQAKETAGSLVGSARNEDRFTILAASAPRSPVVHEVEGSRHEDLAGAVATIPPTAVHAPWPAVLDGVEEVLRSCTYPTRQVTILTDLRKSGWDGGVSPIARKWVEDGVRVRIFDVGSDETANVALLAIVPLDRTILAGAESRWEAVIRNDSPRVLEGMKAILRVDDRPTEVKLPEIAPRAVARVPLTVQFPGAGLHDLSLQLPDDALPGDNQRWAAVPVKDSLLVRLVDGDPSSEPFGSEVDYLAAPLSIGIGAAEAWRVEVALDNDFLNPRLDVPDVLVLANVAALSPEQATRLLKLVREGMGLMIYTGSKVDAGVYNDLLFRGNDKILPTRLKGVVDASIQGVVVEPVRPSPIEKLLELKTTALERVVVRQIMAVDEPAEDDGKVRVLARWNDPNRSPAVVERIVGEGRVLLWTTTADRAGNDWPIEPSFVLAVREAVRGTARPTQLANTLTAGDPMRLIVRSNQQLANARVTPPGGGEPKALTPVPLVEPLDERGPAVSIEVPDTRRAGLYRITWDEGPLGTQQDAYAANPDPRESDLARIAEPELKNLLKPLVVDVASAKGNGADLFASTGREVWHELAWGLFAVLIFESILATWVGRSR